MLYCINRDCSNYKRRAMVKALVSDPVFVFVTAFLRIESLHSQKQRRMPLLVRIAVYPPEILHH